MGSSLRKDGGLSTENNIQTQSVSKGLKYNCLSGSSNSSHDNNNDNENDIILPLDYNFIQVIKITSNMTCYLMLTNSMAFLAKMQSFNLISRKHQTKSN